MSEFNRPLAKWCHICCSWDSMWPAGCKTALPIPIPSRKKLQWKNVIHRLTVAFLRGGRSGGTGADQVDSILARLVAVDSDMVVKGMIWNFVACLKPAGPRGSSNYYFGKQRWRCVVDVEQQTCDPMTESQQQSCKNPNHDFLSRNIHANTTPVAIWIGFKPAMCSAVLRTFKLFMFSFLQNSMYDSMKQCGTIGWNPQLSLFCVFMRVEWKGLRLLVFLCGVLKQTCIKQNATMHWYGGGTMNRSKDISKMMFVCSKCPYVLKWPKQPHDTKTKLLLIIRLLQFCFSWQPSANFHGSNGDIKIWNHIDNLGRLPNLMVFIEMYELDVYIYTQW